MRRRLTNCVTCESLETIRVASAWSVEMQNDNSHGPKGPRSDRVAGPEQVLESATPPAKKPISFKTAVLLVLGVVAWLASAFLAVCFFAIVYLVYRGLSAH